MAKMEKSPEHREKLKKALKAYWAKRRKVQGKGEAAPSRTKPAAKAKPKGKAKPEKAVVTSAGPAIAEAYEAYHAAVALAKEELRKAVAAIVDRTA